MKNRILLIVALMAISCTKSETDNPQPNADGYIKINSSTVEDGTKAIVKIDAALTAVQFLHTQSATTDLAVADFSGLTPFAGSRASGTGGGITFGNAPTYDKTTTNKTSYIIGYHPDGTLASNVVTWTPDGATDILVSDLWNSGTYVAPKTTGLTFRHALSRIEVVCKAATANGLAPAKETWGKITGIKFKGSPTNLTFNYATNAIQASTAGANFSLLNGNTYTTGAFTAVDIQGSTSTTATASAMIPPKGTNTFTLIVSTEKQVDKEITATLAEGVKLESGKIYTATLIFNAADKNISVAGTTITGWLNGGTGDDELKPIEGYAGMFGGELRADEHGEWGFTQALYVDEADIGKYVWSLADGSHSALAGSQNDGKANTWRMYNNSATGFPAAKACMEKNKNYATIRTATNLAAAKAMTDYVWYMPANHQLQALWVVKEGITYATSFEKNFYASSTQALYANIHAVDFGSGLANNGNPKIDLFNIIRCVREL